MAEIYTAKPGDAVTHTPVTENELGWQLEADQGDWFESNSYIIVCKDGALLFIQGLLGSLKPMYTLQPGVHVKYVDAAGKNTHHSEKFETKNLTLSDERATIQISGVTFKRDASKNAYIITIDDKALKDIKGEITLVGCEGGSYKYGEDGKIGFTADKSKFAALYYATPRATVTGKLLVKGKDVIIDGWGFVTHYRQNLKPHLVAVKWHHCKFHSDEVSLILSHLMVPKSHGKAKVFQGSFVYKNKITAITLENDIIVATSQYDKETYYEYPTRVEFHWKGKTLDGENFSAEISVVPTNLLDKIDILGHLPWAIRMIIKTFISRPWHYQWLDNTTARITIGEKTFEVSGYALHECTFVNPE